MGYLGHETDEPIEIHESTICGRCGQHGHVPLKCVKYPLPGDVLEVTVPSDELLDEINKGLKEGARSLESPVFFGMYEDGRPGKRIFSSGATRDTDDGKLDFEGFLSPLVLQKFAEYMHKNRYMADGTLRDSDNWQKGIPKDAYIKSMWRHFFDVWCLHRGLPAREDIVTALCAVLFNVQGYLHEILKEENAK